MTKDPNPVQYPDSSVQQKINGKDLYHAPQSPLTAASGGSLSTGGSNSLKTTDATILTNAIQRIADLESKLKKLGLIK